jgi:hypothetical protein
MNIYFEGLENLISIFWISLIKSKNSSVTHIEELVAACRKPPAVTLKLFRKQPVILNIVLKAAYDMYIVQCTVHCRKSNNEREEKPKQKF